MAEIEFEENCAEIKDYLNTVRECKQQITQIPTVLKKLLDLLNTSTALLQDLCTFADAPDDLQQQCVRSRQQMISFYEGSALKSLTDSIQDVVHQRLMRMEQISQESYMECKRRRDARAKYLSDTTSKGPFNLAQASAEKVQKHKEEYTSRDERYRQACEEFAQYRLAEMGIAQRDFYSGYSGVFALLANALNLPTESALADRAAASTAATTEVNTRLRVRGQHQRPSRSLRANSMTSRTSTAAPAPSPPQPRQLQPPPLRLASEESFNYQRRLSDGVPIDKPAANDEARRRNSSMRSGEVVNGIPVTASSDYGSNMYKYMGSPSDGVARPAAGSSPAVTNGSSDNKSENNNGTDSNSSSSSRVTSTDNTGSSSASSASASSSNRSSNTGTSSAPTSSSPRESPSGNAAGSQTAAAAAAVAAAAAPVPVRKSSSTTLNHYSSVSPDAAPLRHEYSMFNSFDNY